MMVPLIVTNQRFEAIVTPFEKQQKIDQGIARAQDQNNARQARQNERFARDEERINKKNQDYWNSLRTSDPIASQENYPFDTSQISGPPYVDATQINTRQLKPARPGAGSWGKAKWERFLAEALSLVAGGASAYFAYTGIATQPNATYWAIGLFAGVGLLTSWALKGPLHFAIVALRLFLKFVFYAVGIGALIYFAYQLFIAFQQNGK